ncbi:unnamed protein product [Notodromas monacha]|uniref:Uncharacterized protein n=1 Tax=Notodromas monacha TaxID=399045 RepID=A0A7R9BR87_9CRUS|nr:unnamed protein product [Notodromas monacha]CAG0920221.1 unnamed protein product [Notodromas monacha]
MSPEKQRVGVGLVKACRKSSSRLSRRQPHADDDSDDGARVLDLREKLRKKRSEEDTYSPLRIEFDNEDYEGGEESE